MAYTSSVVRTELGPGEVLYTVTESGVDPASPTDYALLDLPGAIPNQACTVLTIKSLLIPGGGGSLTVRPTIRNAPSTSTTDGSVELQTETPAALVYIEPRAVCRASADGSLYFYSTPDADTSTGTTVSEIRVHLGWPRG